MVAKLVGIPSILNAEEAIDVIVITVCDPSDWSVFHVDSEKMICSSFDECLVPFFECLFIKIGPWHPFSEF